MERWDFASLISHLNQLGTLQHAGFTTNQ